MKVSVTAVGFPLQADEYRNEFNKNVELENLSCRHSSGIHNLISDISDLRMRNRKHGIHISHQVPGEGTACVEYQI